MFWWNIPAYVIVMGFAARYVPTSVRIYPGVDEIEEYGGRVQLDRYGAVLAGPTLGFPYVPASGLPGSYFLGCAGGDRCKGF